MPTSGWKRSRNTSGNAVASLERIQKKKAAKSKREEVPAVETDTKQDLKDEMDDILDEIDGVLEENAEEFVKAYVQKGGE